MRGRMITAVAIGLTGLIFIGQGLGLLRGSSVMVDDSRWAIIGAFAVIVGVLIAFSAWRSGHRPDA